MKKSFTVGDRVAWTHALGVLHSGKSVLMAGAVSALDPQATFGTVTGPGNDMGTWWTVEFEHGTERVLTSDELVKVEE